MRRLRREFDDLRRGHYSGSLASEFRRGDTYDIGGADSAGSGRRTGPSLSATVGVPRYAKAVSREVDRDVRGRTRTRVRQNSGQVSSTSAASSSPRHHRQQRDRQRSASSVGPGRNWTSLPSTANAGGPGNNGRSVSLSSSHRTRGSDWERDRGSDLSSPAIGLRRRSGVSGVGQANSRSISAGGYSSTGSHSSNRSRVSSGSARSDKATVPGRLSGHGGDSKGRGKSGRSTGDSNRPVNGIAERRPEDREWDEALFRFSDPILHVTTEGTSAGAARADTTNTTRATRLQQPSLRPVVGLQDMTSVSESLLGLGSSSGGDKGTSREERFEYRTGSARRSRYTDNDSQGSNGSSAARESSRPQAGADIRSTMDGPSASAAPDVSVPLLSTGEMSVNGESTQTDVSDIDRRIQALQSFLDRARAGILGPGEEEVKSSS